MTHKGYFRVLQFYSEVWARAHCRVLISGREHLAGRGGRHRVYIVSHPTTYDLPVLAHLSRDNFYVVVAEGPFAHPLVRWLFRGTGFPMLRSDNSEEVIRESLRLMDTGAPLIYSLKGYGVDFGEDVRPRTGGIRIAHLAGADIYPVHLMIEQGKMIFKYYRDGKGGVYPYTIFWNTLYFATFCEPIRYEDYAREGMRFEDYREIAFRINDVFNRTQAGREQELEDNGSRYRRMRRWGGVGKRVLL
jgi:1-acyl-sn-glycerol-3-phosphate acyltransferase